MIASIGSFVVATIVIGSAIGIERFYVTPEEHRELIGDVDNIADNISIAAQKIKNNQVDILVLRRDAYETRLFDLSSEAKKYRDSNQSVPPAIQKILNRYERDIDTLNSTIKELGGTPQ